MSKITSKLQVTIPKAIADQYGLRPGDEVDWQPWPDEALVRPTIHAAAVYQVNWFDAQILAYAERHGLDTLYSEDFQHGRRYGAVRVINPFLTADRPN